jgi:hypothetical protein
VGSATRGALLVLWGERVVCMRDIFILNEVWKQHKTFLKHFAWMTYFTFHLVTVLAPNYKQHILSSAKLRKVCYSLPGLYVRSVYLNLFGCRGRKVHETS